MNMLKFALSMCFILALAVVARGQRVLNMDSIRIGLKNAKSARQQVDVYFKYADDYFLYNPNISDSLAFAATSIAEVSRDRSLIVATNLRNADRYMQNFSKKSNIAEAITLVQRAFVLAKASGDPSLLLACHNKFARLYRGTGESEKALSANADAIALLPDISDDSLKVVTYNNYGLNLFEKNDMLACFKEYLNALTIAEQSKRKNLVVICYAELAEFYQSLRDFEKSKDYAFKILDAHKYGRDREKVMQDYFRIAEIYVASKDVKMALLYFNQALHVADSLQTPILGVQVKLGMINMYLNNNRFKEGYDLLRNTPEIFSVMKSSGMKYEIDKANAYVQMKLGHYDSSLYYYKQAEPFYSDGSNPFDRFNFYNQYSLLFIEMKKWDQAISMELKARDAVIHTGHLELLARITAHLDTLYFRKGDFQTAYTYRTRYQVYRDSLQKLSKEKDLQSLEIENENKRKERESILAAAELNRRHNLQYLAITVAIGGIFILLVILGLFRVSTAVVKAMGFFAFIFLFEFIILIADNQIHRITHGEPWKVLMIKIGLIAMLLPFHHWLEEKVVHLLISNRLRVSERISRLKSKPVEPVESDDKAE